MVENQEWINSQDHLEKTNTFKTKKVQKKKSNNKNTILFLWKWHCMVTGITETIY